MRRKKKEPKDQGTTQTCAGLQHPYPPFVGCVEKGPSQRGPSRFPQWRYLYLRGTHEARGWMNCVWTLERCEVSQTTGRPQSGQPRETKFESALETRSAKARQSSIPRG